jgi:dTMP kinase
VLSLVNTNGIFISIEGGEGAGKSTLQNRIGSFLDSRNIPFLSTREPGGTPFAEQARSLLLSFSTSYRMNPITEVLLMLAARSDHVEKIIAPALHEGKVVVCDRFVDSTMAYQAYGRNGNVQLLWRLCLEMVPLLPNLTFYLDLPLDEASNRLTHRQKSMRDRMEGEHQSFHERVRNGFLELSRKYSERIVVLDASQAEDIVAAKAIQVLLDRFPERFFPV